jgi:3-(3-hydroxy-phenyl)propionate hydroxylase
MCAAIRDASNLAWKLRAVIKQGVCPSLLDTYESERAPHVQAFIELAVKLGSIIQTTDPAEARARDAKFLSGAPQIFEFPAPRLGPGIWLGQNEPVAQVFPQPVLINEVRLDERVGHHFAVIGERAILNSVTDETKEHWRRLGVVQIDEPSKEIQDWLTMHQAKAVLIRPDRYIVGLARTGTELGEISTALPMPAAAATVH